MKRVFSFFSRPEEDQDTSAVTYRPREPTLQPPATVRPHPARFGTIGTGGAHMNGASPSAPDHISDRMPRGPAMRSTEASNSTEPTVPLPRARAGAAQEAVRAPAAAPERSAERARRPAQEVAVHIEPAAAQPAIPTGYAELIAWFNQAVAERKSPYNALLQAADRLKDYIPNETSRLQAALAICGDKWTPEALSLAINAHVADIESARKKALSHAQRHSAERAAHLCEEAGNLRERNGRRRSEMQELRARLERLEAEVQANDAKLAELDEQIRLAQNGVDSTSFIDQAAENLKNDLLARKVILGLP